MPWRRLRNLNSYWVASSFTVESSLVEFHSTFQATDFQSVVVDLIRSDGTSNYKAIGGYNKSYPAYSPPSWSPDGTQLVYHRCTAYSVFACNEIHNNSLFIYDIETQTERLLLKGGMNPYWRWQKSK